MRGINMNRKIILVIIVMALMIMPAMAGVDPRYVKIDQYGIEPAEWLALVVGVSALINNIGRFIDKKRANPDLKYDYAYLNTTIISILMMCMGVLQTPVVELTPYAIIAAVILGFGGNEGMTRITKVKSNGS